jgi:beta-lactam-binding protein with PASTA domain
MRKQRALVAAVSALVFVTSSCGMLIAQPYSPAPQPVVQPSVPQPQPAPVMVAPPPPVAAPVVVVPGIVGHTLQNAEIILAGNQLRIGKVEYRQGSMQPGTVISQNPGAGAILSSGSRIAVTLALEQTQARVPDLVGMNVAAAALALKLAGLATGEVRYQSAPGVTAPTVGSQFPGAGTFVEPGTAINLVVQTPSPKVVVPSLFGLQQVEVMRALEDAGLHLTDIQVGTHPVAAPGSTISQTPAAGQQVDPGTGVTIVVSTGAGQIAVPNVINASAVRAIAQLVQAGLRSQIEYRFAPGMPDRVFGQSPVAGNLVERGTVVTLTVSRGGVTAFVTVPSVVGSSADDANAAIAEAGLGIGEVTFGAGTPGLVVGQTPAPGSSAQPGSAVSYVIGQAVVTYVVVPNVVGNQRGQAEAMLRNAGLTVGTVSEVFGPEQHAVVSQDPAAQSRVAAGSAVNLTVTRRKTMPRHVMVPNVVGMPRGEAEAKLRADGLEVGAVGETPVGGQPNHVVSQSPAAGTRVEAGSNVDIAVVRKMMPPQRQVMVPNVVGMARGEAEAKLKADGLAVGAVGETPVGGQPNHVVSQSPAAGTRVEAGSKVDIAVVRKMGPPPRTIVPDVVGMARAQAEIALQQAGLAVGVVTEREGDNPGTVVSQLPAAGMRASDSAEVNLVVAKAPAPRTVPVPGVVGINRAQAEMMLRNAGLTVGPVREVAGAQQNVVVSQTPMPGTRVAPTSAVALTISVRHQKPPEQQKVSVPNVVGMSAGAAEAALKGAGLALGTVGTVAGDKADSVVSQSPTAGTLVDAGSAVHLKVSEKQEAVIVPNVVGMELNKALMALRKAGLQPGRVRAAKGGKPRNIVAKQTPAAGASVARGTIVELVTE